MSAVGESSTLLSGKEGSQRLFELLATPQKLVVCVLLGVSLSVNIVCLVPSIPFLLIDADPPINLVIPSGAYGLGATLDLLRHHNLWALYVLIFLFSICFPPLKILATAALLAMKVDARTRVTMFSWLGHLGRWSLLDVYFAMLLIIVAWHQGISVSIFGANLLNSGIRTRPEVGIYLFHAAIICSMAAVTMLQVICDELAFGPLAPSKSEHHRNVLLPFAGTRGYVALLLATATLIMHTCAVALPAFTIIGLTQEIGNGTIHIPLRHFEHVLGSSIYETVPLFAIDMTLFLLIVPAVTMLFCIFVLVVPIHSGRWCHLTIRLLSEWSMFDVFVLALLVYLTQEDRIISLQLHGGAYCMIFYVPLMVATVVTCELVVKAAVEHARREDSIACKAAEKASGARV